ncbi:MAG: peptidyl-prolyl cis-trans isomerase [Myxococcales bacterium]|nr:peptidyl-prolyl cis-trans isomerase [Myxococcales bacterium]
MKLLFSCSFRRSLRRSFQWVSRGERGLLLGVAALSLVGASGCRDLAAKRSANKGNVLAQINETVITVADMEERLNNQSPYVRARYAAQEQKKEYLDNLVKFEVLAAEAKKQGIDRDPEVVRTMKQVMIQKLLRSRFDKYKQEDISDADVQRYFDGHPEEFNRPPEIRASLILVADEATAKKVAADPRVSGLENLGFRTLVSEYSVDQETKERGGDLRFFDQNNRELPKEIVEAAFKLVNVGDVSPVIKTARGYALLKLTGQRRALSRTLAEVAPQIRAKLFRERRQHLMDEYEDALRKASSVQVFPDKLSLVRVDLTQNAVGAPDELRPAPHSGEFHPAGQRAPQASPLRPGAPTTAASPSSAGSSSPAPATPPAATPTATPAAPSGGH